MPPSGAKLGVQSGKDGEDWKCRKALGLRSDGVAGMVSLVGRKPILPGVWMVRPRLLSLRFGGVGGLTKEGDAGAETLSVEVGFSTTGKDPVDIPLPSVNALWVFTARFLRFRAFFAGVTGLFSKNTLASSDRVLSGRALRPSTKFGEVL